MCAIINLQKLNINKGVFLSFMNLPNRLTIARIILTPIFMITMLVDFPFHYLISLLIFAVASFTDMLDGHIARSRNLITNFGKFLDPLADKMLTTAAIIGFFAKGFGEGMAWVLFIVLFREFMISSLRLVLVSSDNRRVVAANIFGKIKTVTQMVGIIFGLVVMTFTKEIYPSCPAMVVDMLYIIFNIFLWSSVIATILSGIIYLKDSSKYINPAI